jgi:uncharacterized protein
MRPVARRDISWEWADRAGLEHLVVQTDETGLRAESLVVVAFDGDVLRVRYTILCDRAYRFQAATVVLERVGEVRRRVIAHEPERGWRVDGAARPDLDGCADIDLMATPFTNTLPIRRLAPWSAAPVAMKVAYIRVPDLDVAAAEQEYTCRDVGGAPSRFTYRNVASGFTAELSIDRDGIVVDYGGIWRRRR